MAENKGKEKSGGMTVQEAGRLGGEKVASERGHEFFEEIGRKGGEKGGERVRELIEKGKQSEHE